MSGGSRHILVRDLVVLCEIGVFPHEHGKKQRVRIALTLDIAEGGRPLEDKLAATVSYSDVIDRIRELAERGRVNLVETLAERIAAIGLADKRVRSATVRVEKLDIYPDGTIVGVEIQRFNENG
ncbi:MAG TPA: dihydroneopterin aldolase [Stellaceae bacterium]|nr:dihydroneopterin aldolase [Stellaceae bacterium]